MNSEQSRIKKLEKLIKKRLQPGYVLGYINNHIWVKYFLVILGGGGQVMPCLCFSLLIGQNDINLL